MSLESAHLHRPTSPASSGRSSPVYPRARSGAEDGLHAVLTSRLKGLIAVGVNRKDKSYRRYASAVERALSLFDTALQEWADYISFLGRLHKALQSRPAAVTEVPHKLLVAKRLAQCLNPALPSGVHQKTIEVYTYIFSILGTEGLARDLPIYLPGLSSTLTFASISIRPALLSLFERSILVLDSFVLRPALKAIILALLPGLEEDTSEEFEWTQAILNCFKAAVGKVDGRSTDDQDISGEQYFWQCIFLASITSASRRQGALAYLVRNLPREAKALDQYQSANADKQSEQKNENEQVLALATEAVISPEPGLLIRCFATGLRDEHLLIQRGFLDLLVSYLPLHSPVLQEKVAPQDLERLVAAAASVTARREMSLNRRLWAWFLGPEGSADLNARFPNSAVFSVSDGNITPTGSPHHEQSRYFRRFGLGPLVQSIVKMIETASLAPSEKARPFRICLSLMDRWEIGGVVVPEVFLPLLESVWLYQKSAPSQEAFDEVQRSASVFFDGVESGLIWGEITKVLVITLGEESAVHTAQSRIELILYLVTKFNVREEEMQMVHIPLATLVLVICLRRSMQRSWGPQSVDRADLHGIALRMVVHLQDLVPERAYAQKLPANRQFILQEDNNSSALANQEYLTSVYEFYERSRGNTDLVVPPSEWVDIGSLLLQNVVQMVLQDLRKCPQAHHIELELSLLDKVIRKVSASELLDKDGVLSGLIQASESTPGITDGGVPVANVTAIVSALETFCTTLPSDFWSSSYKLRQIIPDLIRKLWSGLSPSRPSCNVEAARCIWRLHLISPISQVVEGTIVTLLTMGVDAREHLSQIEVENARRFAILWTHSTTSLSSLQALRPRSARRVRQKFESQKERTVPEMVLLGRPLLLLLDSLHDMKTQLFAFVTSWLQSLPNIQLIVEFLMRRLRSTGYLDLKPGERSTEGVIVTPQEPRDLEECLYHLQTIANLIAYSPDNIWASLATSVVIPHEEQNSKKSTDKSEQDSANFNSQEVLIHDQLARMCLRILEERSGDEANASPQASALRQAAANVLQQTLQGPAFASILQMDIADAITKALTQSVRRSDTLLQVSLMELIITLLRARLGMPDSVSLPSHRKVMSSETTKSLPRLSFSTEESKKDDSSTGAPPPALLDCLLLGLSSPNACPVLENWVQFLDDCLPFYAGSAFQILMPLVDCLNKTISTVFQLLRNTFGATANAPTTPEPLTTLTSLLNGLERALARAHERLVQYEAGTISIKTPEQTQGFFGNMVSGVFTPEMNKSRSATANNRLTVLLCFKDAVLICFEIWTWGDYRLDISSRDTTHSASFNYTSIRLKNRSRRILEHLFTAEALECLETLIDLWHKPHQGHEGVQSTAILNLLHALDGSRPKNTIPAIFNAMYSRANPNALDPSRKSSLTSDLSDVDLAGFLVAYMRSLEDDAMDEIWSDCMTFLRDVLGNPLPHRQTLPRLLEFTAVLGQKVDNTNFGEQRRMRRDLGDLFVRLLAATFTIKPLSFPLETAPPLVNGKASSDTPRHVNSYTLSGADDIVTILAEITPKISKILTDTDRVAAACSTISAQVLTPTFRSKAYPHNVTASTLDILYAMSRIPEASKIWRKDVAEAFNDAKFFSLSSLPLAEEGWVPILRHWALLDKDRMPDLLSRISSPTSAGIVFGVGASSARLEADRKTQLNLRRLALLVLAAADDSFIVNLNVIQEKLSELMSATAASSPSSATRAEVYMLLRALLLKTSSVHLASFWPIINSELYEAISSLFPGQQRDDCSVDGVLQACKLLDTLLVLAPDEFLVREWLFITDTVDAVYRPSGWEPVALVDELVEALDSRAGVHHGTPTPMISGLPPSGKRKPLLGFDAIRHVPTEEVVDRVLRPFFRQLSISAYESTYSMEAPDQKACYDILLSDLFDDSTIA